LHADRFLTRYVFHPLGKALRRPGGVRIPILMYHGISDEPETGYPYFRLNTSRRRFSEQLRFLKENGYKVIPFPDSAQLLETAEPSSVDPTRHAVLTFDDGFEDFRTAAFPLLMEHGFCATVFLPTGFISEGPSILKGKKCMRWSDVRELSGSGVRFGSHTVTHPVLRDLPWDRVERELRESKETLEDRLGAEVANFSYPYAFPEEDPVFLERLRACLVGSGYANGVTTRIGTASRGDDRLFLKRIPVNSEDDPSFFRSKLEGGYDWVHSLQYGYKRLKGLRGRD
jgi:peptidoglycan/xylan/chitin deacetylase (PgdA/CDA1 family)